MDDRMPKNEERKFINLSKPVSTDTNTYTSPNAVNNNFDPASYQQEIYPQNNTPRVAYPQHSSGQEIYPGGQPTLYKESTIPRTSSDMPKVQPTPQNPPAAVNNANVNPYIQTDKHKFCKYCGQQIHIDAVVCTHCGRQVEQLNGGVTPNGTAINVYTNTPQYIVPVSPCSKTSTVLLACLGLIGLGGIHRFYCGKYGSGILYLLTAGLFGFGTIADIIRIATGNFRDGSGRIIKDL